MSKTAHRVYCQNCNGHRDFVGPISHSGKCHRCGSNAMEDNLRGLHFKTGPALLKWRRSIAASVGGILIDDLPAYLDSLRETG